MSSSGPWIRRGGSWPLFRERGSGAAIRLIALLALILPSAISLSPERTRAAQHDLVPSRNAISDFEARLALARILSYKDSTLDESLRHYRLLCAARPADPSLRLEMVQVLLRKGERREARSILEELRPRSSNDPDLLSALARVEAALGHARTARDLYLQALESREPEEDLLLSFADDMNAWGDFYRAEGIYREHLRKHPEDLPTWSKLASLLRSCERYEESEGIYRRQLSGLPPGPEEAAPNPNTAPFLLGLARVKRLEHELETASRTVEQYLRIRPEDPEGVLLKAEVCFLRDQYDQALEAYASLSRNPDHAVRALVGMGKVYLATGDPDRARALFLQAHERSPEDPEARFHLAGPRIRETDGFVRALLTGERATPESLSRWAALYASEGSHDIAVRCYEASLERDAAYFPSKLGLARTLAVGHRYDRALDSFQDLDRVLPGNRSIMIGWARTLAWAKRYEESLALYSRIHALAPSDPVPLKEKARTAVWAKDMDQALDTYQRLLDPPVDRSLAIALAPVAAGSGDEGLLETAHALADGADGGSIYGGYESLWEHLRSTSPGLPPSVRHRVRLEWIGLWPSYRIQKAAHLEKTAKHLAWNRRFIRALDAYEALTRFQPENQEARFDLGQVQCALGLPHLEERTYRELLEMDQRHNLAQRALRRVEIRRQPSLESRYAYWSEEGRDLLSAMDRHRGDLALDVPVGRRLRLNLAAHHWVERPGEAGASHEADGFTLAMNGVLTPHLRGEAAWTHKSYRDAPFADLNTGSAHLQVNLPDAVRLDLGYDRTNELYNGFGMEQGIQADVWSLSIASRLTRKLEVQGEARSFSYSDDNAGRHVRLEGGYDLTDHPRRLNISLFAEHRDTREQNIYQYEGEELINILHPYWTPEDYAAGGIRLEWHHDLSEFFFCGSRTNRYHAAVELGTDSEDNPSIKLTGGWHYEFLHRWTLKLSCQIHRSDLWDAEGLWAGLLVRF